MRQPILYAFSHSCLFNLNGEIERFLVQNFLRDLGDISRRVYFLAAEIWDLGSRRVLGQIFARVCKV